MDNIQKILREITQKAHFETSSKRSSNITRMIHTNGGILLEFNNGRRQLVNVSYRNTNYCLVSTILKRGQVEKVGRDKVLPLLWLRNRETNLVAFSLDKQGRLIGSIEQPSETADADEVFYYLEKIAYECDLLEYLLNGIEDA